MSFTMSFAMQCVFMGLNVTMIVAVIVLIIVHLDRKFFTPTAYSKCLMCQPINHSRYHCFWTLVHLIHCCHELLPRIRFHVFSRSSESKAHFSRRISDAIEEMDSTYFLSLFNQRWLSVQLNAVGYFMFFVAGILVVTFRFLSPRATQSFL